MAGELDLITGLWHAIVFVITAQWADLEPYVTRVVHLTILVLATVWMWNKITGKK
jgi:hypothetical protein